jgi:hypothetical protein
VTEPGQDGSTKATGVADRNLEPADERTAAEQADAAPTPTSGLAQLTRILGAVVAPTTLLTSVLFYFGWMHAYHFFDYFGVNSTVLGLTTQDYLMRSLDGLFVPMTVLAGVGLLALWGHAVLRVRLAAGPTRWAPRAVPALVAAGLALAAAGLASVLMAGETLLDGYLYDTAAPLCLALGVGLLLYAVQLWRLLAKPPARSPWAMVAEWAAVFALVGLSLFWAASNYSLAVGYGRAADQVAALPRLPGAVVYSHQRLSLHAPGVREVPCRDPEAAYRFRYDGLKLVLQAGGQYVFLPAAWTRTDGVAILLPRSDALRLEFFPSSSQAAVQRPSC